MSEDIETLVAEVLQCCAQAGDSSTLAGDTFVKLYETHVGLQNLSTTELKAIQPTIERALYNIMFGKFHNHAPCLYSVNFFQLIGDTWKYLFAEGDTRNLLTVASDLLDHIGACGRKGNDENGQNRNLEMSACYHYLGCLFSVPMVGRMLSGHFKDTIALVYKAFKSSTSLSSVRDLELYLFTMLHSLKLGVCGSGTAGNSVYPVAVKIASKAIDNKFASVSKAAVELLEIVAENSDDLDLAQLESMLSVAHRGIENQDANVRQASARALATILSSSVVKYMALERSTGRYVPSSDGEIETSNSSSVKASCEIGQSSTSNSNDEARRAAEDVAADMKQPTSTSYTRSRDRSVGDGQLSPPLSSLRIRGSKLPKLLKGSEKPLPVGYTLKSALQAISKDFNDWSYKATLKRKASSAASMGPKVYFRSNDIRLAYAQAAVELVHKIRKNCSYYDRCSLHQDAVEFAFAISQNGEETNSPKTSSGNESAEKLHDFAFRRSVIAYFLGCSLSSDSSENEKIEICRFLLDACGFQLSQKYGDELQDDLKHIKFSRAIANPIFVASSLQEISSLISTLSDAAAALEEELALENMEPLLKHFDCFVRHEACNLMYVFAVVHPMRIRSSLRSLLNRIGDCQVELGDASFCLESVENKKSADFLRTLIHLLCAFIYASCVRIEPTSSKVKRLCNTMQPSVFRQSTWIDRLMKSQIDKIHLISLYEEGIIQPSTNFRRISCSLSTSILGFAKSMIARQFDKTGNEEANYIMTVCGWEVIGALSCLEPSWSADNVEHLLPAWSASIAEAELALLHLSTASKESFLASDRGLFWSLYCLQASILALYNFVRCNQALLQHSMVTAEAIVLLLIEIMQCTATNPSRLPHQKMFASLHATIFDIASWLPRCLLRKYKVDLSEKLFRLTSVYAIESSYAISDHSVSFQDLTCSVAVSDSNSLLYRYSKPTATINEIDSCSSLFGISWNSELCVRSRRLELLLAGQVLSERESHDSAMTSMMSSTYTAAFQRVATPASGDGFVGDSFVNWGMLSVPNPCSKSHVLESAISLMSIIFAYAFEDSDRDINAEVLVRSLKTAPRDIQVSALGNVVSAFTLTFEIMRKSKSMIEYSTDWLVKARQILSQALIDGNDAVCSKAALGLAMLVEVAGSDFGSSAMVMLSNKIEGALNHQSDKGQPAKKDDEFISNPATSFSLTELQCRVAMVQGLISRVARVHDTSYLKVGFVYDLCKYAPKSTLAWVLNSWVSTVEMAGADAADYLAPSLLLINTHMFSDRGFLRGSGPSISAASLEVLSCIARLVNALVAGLGPDLALKQGQLMQFVAIWDSLRRFGSACPSIRYECVLIVQQLSLFCANGILSNDTFRERVENYLLEQTIDVSLGDGTEVASLALQTMAILNQAVCRTGNGLEKNFDWGIVALGRYELHFRRALFQDGVIPLTTSQGQGAFLIQKLFLSKVRKDAFTYWNDKDTARAKNFDANGSLYDQKVIGWNDGLRLANIVEAFFCQLTSSFRSALSERDFENLEYDLAKECSLVTNFALGLCSAVTGSIGTHTDKGDADGDEDFKKTNFRRWLNLSAEASHSLLLILCDSSWRVKSLALGGFIEILELVKHIPVQRDLLLATEALKIYTDCNFLPTHLSNIVVCASQAAMGRIQGAEVPQLSILGYLALSSIVQIFSASADPHSVSDSILKQYEVTLIAALSPGLSMIGSPNVVHFVCILAAELVRTGVATHPKSIFELLVPQNATTFDSDASSIDSGHNYNSYGKDLDEHFFDESVYVECDLVRIQVLSELYLYALGFGVGVFWNGAGNDVSSVSYPRHKDISKPRKSRMSPQDLRKSIRNAFTELFSSKNGLESDLTVFFSHVIQDTAEILYCIKPYDQSLEPKSLRIVGNDAVFRIFPMMINAGLILCSALSNLPHGFSSSMDSESMVYTFLFLACNLEDLSSSGVAVVLAFLNGVFSRGKKCETLTDELKCSMLHFLCDIFGYLNAITDRKTRVSLSSAAMRLMRIVLKDAKLCDYLGTIHQEKWHCLWRSLFEGAVQALHSCSGDSNPNVATNQRMSEKNALEVSADCQSTKLKCYEVIKELLRCCPLANDSRYLYLVYWLLLSKIKSTSIGVEDLQLLAAAVCHGGDTLIRATVCNEIANLSAIFCTRSTSMSPASCSMLKNIEICLESSCVLAFKVDKNEEQLKRHAVSLAQKTLRRCIDTPEIRPSAIRILSKEIIQAPKASNDQLRNLVENIGPLIARQMLETPESLGNEDAKCASAFLVLTCGVFPELVRLALTLLLRICADIGGIRKYSSETREQSRHYLVKLAKMYPQEVKQVVSSFPPYMANALREQIQAAIN